MVKKTNAGMDIRSAKRAVEALRKKIGHTEAVQLLAASGMGPSVVDKLCGDRYESDLRKKNARALIAALRKANVPVDAGKAS